MDRPSTHTILYSFLYGSASTLFAFNLFFLVRAIIQHNFVPIVPIVAGMLLAAGLLSIVYGESRARKIDKKEHRSLARIAHQLEHPLTTLQEDLSILIKHASKLPAEDRMRLKKMSTKSTVLLENIRDILLLLRAREDGVSKELRMYNVCVLVKNAVEDIKQLALARNVEITTKDYCHDASVFIEKPLFHIALIHILENAVFYMTTPGVVNVAVIKGDDTVKIIVQDRGIGINKQEAPSVFQPFTRGERAQRIDPDGIGVGLSLSRLIIREFGGSLSWRPRGGGAGTEFEINLPLASSRR